MTIKSQRLPSPSVGLKGLAEQLGLAQSTVSRALRKHPGIPDKTRRRVMAAAEKVGYQPNARARGLAIGRTEAIGLVFPIERLQLEETNFVDVLAGISDVVTRRNHSLLLSPFSGDEGTVLRKLASSKAVDGVIITRPLVHDPRIALLVDLGLPFVVHGRSEVAIPYSCVDVDNFAIFEKLTRLLLDYGHRRIVALNSFLQFRYAAARAAGFRKAWEARGLQPDQAQMLETPMTEQAGHDCAARALAAADAPTAFICGSIFLARGVYRAVAERGLEVGRDVSVVCHDDGLRGIRASDFNPPLTATYSSVREHGEHLAAVLIDLTETRTGKGPVQRILAANLILRESVALAP
jgi:LacI family transcriptional regulator